MKTAKAIAKGIALGAILIAAAVLTSCTMTIDGTGNRSLSFSGEQAARAIVILSEK